MRTAVFGIDEAGYGPLLGPLCVGMSGFVVGPEPAPPAWDGCCDAGPLVGPWDGVPADAPRACAEPPLWSLLGRAVSRGAGDDRGRVAIADSKALVRGRAQRGRARAELLAAGVCAFMDARHLGAEGDGDAPPESPAEAPTDLGVLERLGVRLRAQSPAWARGVAAALPESWGGAAALVRARAVDAAMRAASVRCVGVWARAMFEPEFNRLTAEGGSKAAASGAVVGDLMRRAWALTRAMGLAGLIVCDRQGGRRGYGPTLAAWIGPEGAASVDVVAEGPDVSEYHVRTGVADGPGVRVRFRVRAESCSLPVALASMSAKLARELLMARFNAHYAGRARQRGRPEPAPTAGYTADARRWLCEAGGILDPGEADELVRIA